MTRKQREAIYYSLTVMGIYTLSFVTGIRILQELFDEIPWNYTGVKWVILLAVVTQGWNAAAAWGIPRGMHRIGKLVITIFAAVWAVGFGMSHATEFAGGGIYLAQRYISKWNLYFHTNLYLGSGDPYNYQIVFTFVAVLLYLVAALISMWRRRNGLAVLFPTIAIALVMLVGYTPGWVSVMMWTISIVLVHNRAWQKQIGGYRSVFATILLLLVIGGVCGFVFCAPARVVTEKEHEMLALQHRIENTITSVGFAPFITDGDNRVDNHMPKYSGTEAMRVTVDTMMMDNLYLRGSYGVNYENRQWTKPEGEFTQACDKAGLDVKEAAMTLAELPFHVQSLVSGEDEMEMAQFRMNYTGIVGSTVYLPYGMDVVSAEEPLEIADDFTLVKPWSQDEVNVEGVALAEYPLYADLAMYEIFGAMPINAWNQESSTPVNDLSENDRIFADFYNEYVQQHYMEAPKNQPAVEDAADTLKTNNAVILAQKYSQGDDVYTVNFGRIMLAEMVREYLAEREDYNLQLERIDSDTDPIEYFLEESHQGYCVHFASAGVLILRQLGIPCRYASGYVARSSRFEQKGEQYVASVLDSSAHAWAEVYLDDYGWLPIDMTDGYSSDNKGFGAAIRSARNNLNSNLALIDADTLLQDNTDDNQANAETGSENQSAETQNAQTDDSEQSSETEYSNRSEATSTDQNHADKNGAGTTAYGDTVKKDRIRRALPRITAVLIAFLVVYLATSLLRKNQNKRNERRITRSIRRGRYSTAVRQTNYMVYHQLRRKRHHIHVRFDDEQYFQALVTAYPQISSVEWERYMLLVRRAAYSKNELTQEEAVFVLGIADRTHKQN